MVRRLSLDKEYKELYSGSDLQRVINSNPLPIKFTINDFECYFYNPDLFGLFELRINNDGLSPDHFIDDYRQGFEKGMQHLKKVEKIKLKDLKNVHLREHTINQLKDILFNREFKNGVQGLINTIKAVPLLFTSKVINDYGYWNGIMYSIDSLCQKAGLTLEDLKTSTPQQLETNKPDEVTTKHPKHNPNYWNTDCFELFKYLYDEYYKGTKRQLTNIWFYLKEYNNQKYILSITKDLYKDFIIENYGIVITNFDKAQQKWEDTEYRKLDEHRQNFEDGLK